jgi:hypothetical protein
MNQNIMQVNDILVQLNLDIEQVHQLLLVMMNRIGSKPRGRQGCMQGRESKPASRQICFFYCSIILLIFFNQE